MKVRVLSSSIEFLLLLPFFLPPGNSPGSRKGVLSSAFSSSLSLLQQYCRTVTHHDDDNDVVLDNDCGRKADRATTAPTRRLYCARRRRFLHHNRPHVVTMKFSDSIARNEKGFLSAEREGRPSTGQQTNSDRLTDVSVGIALFSVLLLIPHLILWRRDEGRGTLAAPLAMATPALIPLPQKPAVGQTDRQCRE